MPIASDPLGSPNNSFIIMRNMRSPSVDREAAALGCSCRQLRSALSNAWAAGAFQPTVAAAPAADGNLSDPPGGRFCLELSPGDDIQRALDTCPAGGAVLLREGLYTPGRGLVVHRDMALFGRGLVTISQTGEGSIVRSTADRASLIGICFFAVDGPFIEAGGLRLQDVSVMAEFTGITVRGPAARPTVVGCHVGAKFGCYVGGGGTGSLVRTYFSGRMQ